MRLWFLSHGIAAHKMEIGILEARLSGADLALGRFLSCRLRGQGRYDRPKSKFQA